MSSVSDAEGGAAILHCSMGGREGWGLRAVVLALAGIGGAALQLQQAHLWTPAQYGLTLTSGLALLILGCARASARAFTRLLVLVAALACMAFSITGLRAGVRMSQALATNLEGQDLVITGVVTGLPRQMPDGVRFGFEIESATQAGVAIKLPERVSLGWYRGWDGDALIAAPFEQLRAGQRWRLPVRLKAPHGLRNPHGFDFELWLFEQNIRATGDVRATDAAPARLLEAAASDPVSRWRQKVRDAIALSVADPRAAGVLAALAVGDQAAIDRSDWELFRATGVAHLVSISGLHVTMFAWLAGAAIGALWRRSARLTLWLPAPTAGRWAGLACAMAYAMLAGWGVPAQ
ncbi:MAG: ComEC/Rec2 family competence protein, partial [Rubrivivax sp.]